MGTVDRGGGRDIRPDLDNFGWGRPSAVACAIGLYIMAAYWFTASTSFANPAVTIARALSDTFARIAPNGVLQFIAAQFVGAIVAMLASDWFWPLKRAGRR